MTELGLVSRHLEAALREEARKYGILIWLDKEGAYREFAEALRARGASGQFPFPVRAFRGSFLQLMLELDGLEDGVDMTPLIVHVPGHNEEDIRATPLLELYRGGRRHRCALATVVREAAHERATVEQLNAFLARPGLTLAGADRWLDGLLAPQRADELELGAVSAQALFDDLMRDGELAQQLAHEGAEKSVWRRAELLLGITRDFQRRFAPAQPGADVSPRARASDLALDLAAWAMCVEFVHDLKRQSKDAWLLPLEKLPKPVVRANQELARHIRDHHAASYTSLADETEQRLPRETSDATAEDLGHVDTFRFEDRKILAAALQALARRDYRAAHDWAVDRIESFWAREVPHRKRAWQLVLFAARLGLALEDNQRLLERAKSLQQAVERYAQRGYQVDAAHRSLEQARQQAAVLEIDEFAELRERLNGMRFAYRAWADAQAVAFNALCQDQGYLPPPALRQRELFEEVVRPWAQLEGVTAYFTVDALRFEMAQRLHEALVETGTGDVVLKARLAELPTVTEVGMNALAPVCVDGRLQLDLDKKEIRGVRAQGVRVATPEDRRRVMHERVGGKTCPKLTLEEVLNRDVTSLRRAIAEARLVLIHCEGIDKAGEKGVGLTVFEQELQFLRAAWRQLYDAGVQRFVFTADHGFLLHDPLTRAPVPHGFKTEPKRRHVVSPDYLEREGKVAVRAAELEYDSKDATFLFPETAAPFDLGDRAKDFVHGGNSLQERVIPVLTMQHRHAAGAETAKYLLEAAVEKPVARMNCLAVTIRLEKQHTLSFSSSRKLELALECIDDPKVYVELCDARAAEVVGNAVFADVEQRFEIFFRLRGETTQRVRVRIKHATGSTGVPPLELLERFEVEPTPASAPLAPAPSKPKPSHQDTWLSALPEGGVREVFRYLAQHGTINEAEATSLLGGPRQFRAFSARLEQFVSFAPFRVRVEVSSGTKCYVRMEG